MATLVATPRPARKVSFAEGDDNPVPSPRKVAFAEADKPPQMVAIVQAVPSSRRFGSAEEDGPAPSPRTVGLAEEDGPAPSKNRSVMFKRQQSAMLGSRQASVFVFDDFDDFDDEGEEGEAEDLEQQLANLVQRATSSEDLDSDRCQARRPSLSQTLPSRAS